MGLYCPIGDLGLYHSYKVDCFSVTAYGYLKNHGDADVPTCLFSTDCGDVRGLGIASDADHKINKLSYVQFDLCSLLNNYLIKKVKLTINQIQRKSGFELYGSNCLGKLGELLYKSREHDETQSVTVPDFGEWKYIAVTAYGCDDLAQVLVERLCIYAQPKPFDHAYAFVYSYETIDIPLGGTVPFTNVGPQSGFSLLTSDTIQCNVKGVYLASTNVSTSAPNAFSLYLNNIIVQGSWYGTNVVSPGVGQVVLELKENDTLKLVNQSSAGGTVTLAPLGSGSNPTAGQTTVSLSLWRIA